MDTRRIDWYVRHKGYLLHVDPKPKHNTNTLPLFKADSSFIVHPNKFHQGKYALESVNLPGHYISSQADGRLKIVARNQITDLRDASFRVSDFITPSTYHRSVCSAAEVLFYRSLLLLLFYFF